MDEPRTFPEMLDAAQSDEEFGGLLSGMFSTFAAMRDEEEG